MLIKAARFLSRSAVILLLLCIISFASVYVWHDNMMTAAGPHQDDVLVIISPGSGHNAVRHVLKRAGVIHQVYHYDVARIFAGETFSPKAGEFLLPAKSNLKKIFSIIHEGRNHQRRLTIVEGLRSADVLKLITAMPNLTGSVKSMPDEGSLRPETYFYIHATPRQALIKRMQESRALALAEAWSKRAKDLPYDSPYHALIMASIIEKEASAEDDRRLVAAVLVNRLKKGMRLQSDPTVLYEAFESPPKPPRITKTDLKTYTPWNTYVITGLPKTPICNPGQESIMAALHPAKSDYVYFVSDGEGGLRFAKTLDAHNRNVRLFRQYKAAVEKGRGK
ncbi:endolytic transglycosylase MltG [Candidatus Puniceispirillum sp.]|nr:endolytic transglycosylase MltG [Candidatus Puniceispirillum sp.]